MSTAAVATTLAGCDAYVIAGGLGTRIQPVLGETPKLLAPVAGRPYLQQLLEWLAGFGLRRVVFGLGHRAQAVVDYLREHPHPRLAIESVVEPAPLGTAGAIRFARPQLRSDPVLVMNGDGIVDCDLKALFDFHRATRAAGTIVVAAVEDARPYGRIEVAGDRIASFREKDVNRAEPALVNAGIYLLGAPLLDQIASGTARSLETDVFARLPAGTLAAYRTSGTFIDIGTPERLELANARKPAQ
jgi:mannose-1-phosphate guanylyltransferase